MCESGMADVRALGVDERATVDGFSLCSEWFKEFSRQCFVHLLCIVFFFCMIYSGIQIIVVIGISGAIEFSIFSTKRLERANLQLHCALIKAENALLLQSCCVL